MTLPDDQPRIDWSRYDRIAPAVSAALLALGKAIDASGLDKSLTELVKLRASQINDCAYCIQYHLNAARRLGIPDTKLDSTAAWRDADVFSARERAAFAWTECLTLIAENGAPDAAYAELEKQFSESEIAFLTAAVGNINAWNRIAGALRFSPPEASS